jgi:hypothetical protein
LKKAVEAGRKAGREVRKEGRKKEGRDFNLQEALRRPHQA